jgi:hypothetical protein
MSICATQFQRINYRTTYILNIYFESKAKISIFKMLLLHVQPFSCTLYHFGKIVK